MEGSWALKMFVPMPARRWTKLLTISNAPRGGAHLQTISSPHTLSTLQDFPLLMSKAAFLFVWHLCAYLNWQGLSDRHGFMVGTVKLETWETDDQCGREGIVGGF